MVVPLLGVLGSCGGSATSHSPKASAGAANASPSGAGADGTGAGASDAGAGSAGESQLGSAGTSAAAAGAASGHGGVGTAGAAIANGAGAAGDGATAGAAGAGDCVDVCELRGEACCLPLSCVSADASCKLEVFDQQVSITHEYAPLEQLVATLPESFLASISTADVTSSAAEPFPSSRIELRLSAVASSQYGTALEGALLHPFRVSCAGKRLFVGLVYQQEGAAALALPVLHVARGDDDIIALRLGAWQSAWLFSGNAGDVAARARLDAPELRATLCLNAAPEAL